ncbi:MAG TPA: glutaredoxin 3 [Burkholderiaceae bacterium]|nr:glutaredoxin 3 [Burkholderiaceae bacterium]
MNPITIYGTQHCPYCHEAENHLRSRGAADIRRIAVDTDPVARQEMALRTGGRRSVPQIFIGATHVGGYDDLVRLDRAGALMPLLGQ